MLMSLMSLNKIDIAFATASIFFYSSRFCLTIRNGVSKVKVSAFIQRLYCSTSHSRRSGTDHTVFTCKLHHTSTCLYLISVHQMAHPQTDLVDI